MLLYALVKACSGDLPRSSHPCSSSLSRFEYFTIPAGEKIWKRAMRTIPSHPEAVMVTPVGCESSMPLLASNTSIRLMIRGGSLRMDSMFGIAWLQDSELSERTAARGQEKVAAQGLAQLVIIPRAYCATKRSVAFRSLILRNNKKLSLHRSTAIPEVT